MRAAGDVDLRHDPAAEDVAVLVRVRRHRHDAQRRDLSLRKFFHDVFRIVQRPAAERREAGAEDQAGVDQVGVGDDALGEHRLGLVQVGLDQRVDQLLVIGIGLPLDRLAVHVAVDALAGLLAEVAERHLVGEDLGHRGRALGERLAGGEADVEAHGVGELRRPHRHAEVLHRAVERLGLRALVEHAERVQHVRAEHAVHQEAGRVLRRQRQLVDVAHERGRLLRQLGIGLSRKKPLPPAAAAAPG